MHHIYKNNFRLSISLIVLSVIIFSAALYLVNFKVENKSLADTQVVNLSASTQTAMDFSTSAGSTVAFGNLTSGSPIAAPVGGTVLSVTTNAVNGYTIGVSDGISGSNSCLVSAGNYIADYAGTISSPTSWTGTGLGITMFAADTNKESAWGTGTTYNDVNNKYAGIPQNPTVAHTVTGYRSSADTSSWAFKLDVPPGQAAGNYSGSVTFTATAVLS
jgi:hypothetical protein